MAATPPTVLPALAVRGSRGISLLQPQDGLKEVHSLYEDGSNKSRVMAFSDDGSHFAYCNGESLKVIDMSNGETAFETAKQKTVEIKMSPKNNYIATWEPFYTTPQNPQGSNNLEVFHLKTGTVAKSVIHKKQTGWSPSWTLDEVLCARCVSNEVQFYTNQDLQKASSKLYLQGASNFSISPAAEPYLVAVHISGKKGSPSSVRLYQYPNIGDGQAIANRSFFKADKVDMLWNKKGSALLILVSAEVDTTGTSYYGEQSLHFLSARGDSSLVPLNKNGPIYSVDWNPNSSQFCVVYGYMPAKASLFNLKCEPIFDYGTGPRNICMYNPHGNILCLAGFGNLSGNMEMWNVDGKKLICKLQSRDTTNLQWCADGQHIVISTCAPRLRVSNGYKIWHYSGQERHKYDVPTNSELWQALWQNQPDGTFPVPKIITKGVATEVKKEAYRPPSARGAPSSNLKIHENELPQNQRNQENMSAAALKNKKKREAKAKAKQESEPVLPMEKSTPSLECGTTSTGDPEVDKKIKGLRKKLKAIEDLKAKKREGKQLEKNQIDKLNSEKDLLKELRELELSS